METYKKIVVAGLFVFASTGVMMAMENNPEQDGETTPRDQVNTDKKILENPPSSPKQQPRGIVTPTFNLNAVFPTLNFTDNQS